eukprot:scaffold888_cov246-Pinguiococcus_pyrenoidosus.AAC.11
MEFEHCEALSLTGICVNVQLRMIKGASGEKKKASSAKKSTSKTSAKTSKASGRKRSSPAGSRGDKSKKSKVAEVPETSLSIPGASIEQIRARVTHIVANGDPSAITVKEVRASRLTLKQRRGLDSARTSQREPDLLPFLSDRCARSWRIGWMQICRITRTPCVSWSWKLSRTEHDRSDELAVLLTIPLLMA